MPAHRIDPELRRDVRITARFSEAEREALQAIAGRQRTTISEVIRQSTLAQQLATAGN